MSFDNIHPDMLVVVLGSLPVGARLSKAISVDEIKSTMEIVTLNNQEVSIPIDKLAPAIRLDNRVLSIDAEEGELLETVIQRFSKQYKLPLLKDVDYMVGEKKVVFKDQTVQQIELPIETTSVFLTGVLTFKVVAKTGAIHEFLDPVDPSIKDAFILFGKDFRVDGKVIKSEKFTEAALDAICEHAESCGGFNVLDRETLASGTVGKLKNDGISQFTCVHTTLGSFFIRFASEKS